jgi:hypothetical protein
MQMVGVDDDGFTSGLNQVYNGDVKQWSTGYGEQWFWDILGIRLQTGAEARCQYHGFHI